MGPYCSESFEEEETPQVMCFQFKIVYCYVTRLSFENVNGVRDLETRRRTQDCVCTLGSGQFMTCLVTHLNRFWSALYYSRPGMNKN